MKRCSDKPPDEASPPSSTKPLSRRDRERIERREWILDTALDLVLDQGIEGVTTLELAKRLGYTVGATYRYFESKERLLAALHRRTAEHFYSTYFSAWRQSRDALQQEPPVQALDEQTKSLVEILLLARVYRQLALSWHRHFRYIALVVINDRTWLSDQDMDFLREMILPYLLEIFAVFNQASENKAIAADHLVERCFALWVSLHSVLAASPMLERHGGLLSTDSLWTVTVENLLIGFGATSDQLHQGNTILERISIEIPPYPRAR